jgi:hypothetical protein
MPLQTTSPFGGLFFLPQEHSYPLYKFSATDSQIIHFQLPKIFFEINHQNVWFIL